MPDVYSVLALVRQFPCIGLIAMTIAERGHVVLQSGGMSPMSRMIWSHHAD